MVDLIFYLIDASFEEIFSLAITSLSLSLAILWWFSPKLSDDLTKAFIIALLCGVFVCLLVVIFCEVSGVCDDENTDEHTHNPDPWL